MGEYSLIILATVVFALLWSLAKKVPKLLARHMDRSRRAFGTEFNEFGVQINTFQVYSVETADGKEAEYIDENLPHLPQGRKIVRYFRAFLISLYVLATIYFLYMSR